MNIAITGASGLIGRRLIELLSSHGHALRALSRGGVANFPPGVRASVWDADKGEPPIEALRRAQIHVYRHPELINSPAGTRGPNCGTSRSR